MPNNDSNSTTAALARAGHLYVATLRSVVSRLRYDLAREITVAVSSIVLLATFAYVFNDFLNVQIANLSPAMRNSFAFYLAIPLLLVAAALTGRCLSSEWLIRRGFGATARALGDTPLVIKSYRIFIYFSLILAVHGSAWWIVYKWLVRWSFARSAATEGFMLLVTALVVWYAWRRSAFRRSAITPPRNLSEQSHAKPTIDPAHNLKSKVAILSRWRLMQILFASRLCRIALICAGLFMVLVAFSAFVQLPAFVAAVASLVAGLWVGACLSFQMSEDLEYAWFERCLGVSHDDFIAGYERTGATLAGTAALVAGLCYLIGALGSGAAIDSALLQSAAKAALVAATPALIAPCLLLQIDGRRVFVTGLTIAIVSLFVATAIIAHWLSVVLIPLLRYFAKDSQVGRFYRA